jgi:hypothetical protein
MARDDRPQKAKNKKYADPKTGDYRHSDGDRRHRRGASAKDAVKQKKLMHEQGGLPPEADEDGPADASDAGE